MGQRTCSVLAHNKMLLHALKYLSRPVFGVLIGTTYKDKESSNTFVHIMDAIPLQHNFFSSMVVEIAFMQIQEWLNKISKSNSNLRMLGVYFANGHAEDVSKSTSAIIVASQLVKEYSRATTILCQVISDRIESAYAGNDSALDWYMLGNKGDSENKRDWKDVEDVYLVKTSKPRNNEPKVYHEWLSNVQGLQSLDVDNKKFQELNLKYWLANKADGKVYDFEDHLDDLSKDWRNLQLFNL